MSSSTTVATRRSVVATVVVLAILVVLLAALAVLYYVLQRPASFATTGGNKDRNYLFSIYGFQGDLLRRPTGVGFDGQGNIYVADTGKRRIVEFDPAGNFLATFGDPGRGKYQLWDPISVSVSDDGRAYVVDKTQKKLVIFDSTHKPAKEIVFKDEAPISVNVQNKQLFVTTPSGVVIGDLDGRFVTGYVKRGKGTGEFDIPGAVAVGKDGTLYVADSLNYRVQAISTTGKVKWVYGTPIPAKNAVQYSGKDRKFGLPSSIAVDDNGFLYVVDGLSSELVVLDSNGQLVERMGSVGHADGSFYYPDGIAYRAGRLVVADKFNDRVEVFSDPRSPALGDQARAWAPWSLLLLLIPLGFIPALLARRRSNYVMTPGFADALQANDQGPEIARTLKRVLATDFLVGWRGQDFEGLTWLERKTDPAVVADIADRYEGMDPEDVRAIAIAMGQKGRVLLSEDPSVRRVATELDVTTLSLAEMLSVLGEKDADEKSVGEAS